MKHKVLGQVYTPKWIVNEILDLVGYNSQSIIDKYILEPACGDGAFLIEIVNRYIDVCKFKELTDENICKNLGEYIVGIEIDQIEFKKTVMNLNNLVRERLGEDHKVEWKIYNENTLDIFNNHINKYDYVVGNPPYIRIHNLDNITRKRLKDQFVFSEGTIDLYLSFFEMGLKMIKINGIVGYITPNSYMHNSSYKLFREYVKLNKLIKVLIDFKSNKIFKNFSTYTAITVLSRDNDRDSFEYKELVDNKILKINDILFKDLSNKNWSFSNNEDADFIESIRNYHGGRVKDYFDVQYGFATLRDKIFISSIVDFNDNLVHFNNYLVEKSILKKIVKGSRFKGNLDDVEYIIFPYKLKNKRYIPISEEELRVQYPNTYSYLLSKKDELVQRDLDKGAQWFEFGRSQGIQTMHNEKIVLSTLVNGCINYYKLPEDIFVYSGLFIIKNKPYSEWCQIEEILSSESFYKYIRITGKDFSGGYKSITSKQIKEFNILNNNLYKLSFN